MFNIHLYPSNFTNETRILRVTKSLCHQKIFHKILILASLRDDNLNKIERIDENRKVIRIETFFKRGSSTLSKSINMLEWNLRALSYGIKSKVSCINAHSLSVLPVCVLLKFVTGCRLVYEPHEIETETTEVNGVRKIISKFIEKKLITFADYVICTSDGHSYWYKRAYPQINTVVIRNTPYRNQTCFKKSDFLRKRFSIPDDDLVFIYQGSLSRPRGVELIADVFRSACEDRHIVFLGFGPLRSTLLKMSHVIKNIHVMNAVPPEEVASITSGADVGIHMMDNSCLNHCFALPNKPMEYLNAGIPAIVTNLPEMGKLVLSSKAGWVVTVNAGEQLLKLVDSLTTTEIIAKGKCAEKWAEENNWETEEKLLFDVYKLLGL